MKLKPGWALERATQVSFSDDTTKFGIPGNGEDEQAESPRYPRTRFTSPNRYLGFPENCQKTDCTTVTARWVTIPEWGACR